MWTRSLAVAVRQQAKISPGKGHQATVESTTFGEPRLKRTKRYYSRRSIPRSEAQELTPNSRTELKASVGANCRPVQPPQTPATVPQAGDWSANFGLSHKTSD